MEHSRQTSAHAVTPQAAAPSIALAFENVSLAFDDHVVLRDVSFTVPKGSMRVVLGASGTGKSVMLKLILGLLRPDAGKITVNGQRVDDRSEQELLPIRADIGMVFQEMALFDSLTVAENVGYRLYEETSTPLDEVRGRVQEVLGFVGLGEFIDRMPATLSGGQRRRVAIARALASQPSLVLLDDPTTGLDPIIATTVDDEIVKLRDLQRVTLVFVTHQIRDAFYIATHRAARDDGQIRIAAVAGAADESVEFMVLHQGRIHFEGSGAELLASEDKYLQEFLVDTLPPW
jgi:phospholipid/cholesterol/gamma-HCH transport system ATP-binding protein